MNLVSDPKSMPMLNIYRVLMLVTAAVYLTWWKAVEVFLPGSFNPIGSRLAVVFFCLTVCASSFVFKWAAKHISIGFSSCLWLITGHYFYLLYGNHLEANWIVGTFVMVIAAAAIFQSEAALLSYSCWVLLLSAAIHLDRSLPTQKVFFPGIFTVLLVAYIGLRYRLRWLGQILETSFKFRSLFDAAFEGILVHENGNILDTNEAFAEILGYSTQELIGIHLTELVPTEVKQTVLDQIKRRPSDPYELVAMKKGGGHISLEVRGKDLIIQGRPLRLVTVRDITDRKKAEQDRVLFEATQSAIHMRDEFLSIASHELKTPLTNIKIQTQIAMEGFNTGSFLTPEKVQKFIEHIDRQADRLTRLVEEMLDVTRITAGKMKMHFEEMDLSELVREVSSAFEPGIQQMGSSLHLDLPPSCFLRADRFRIEQVISNLLSNAMKYGNKKPIQIRLMSRLEEVVLIVEDQGIGISLQNQERIFERFERAISSKKISGLGLGLYICKHIVDAHRGSIEVISRPEAGAHFKVTLPKNLEKQAYE